MKVDPKQRAGRLGNLAWQFDDLRGRLPPGLQNGEVDTDQLEGPALSATLRTRFEQVVKQRTKAAIEAINDQDPQRVSAGLSRTKIVEAATSSAIVIRYWRSSLCGVTFLPYPL